jgi:hypothetical protein
MLENPEAFSDLEYEIFSYIAPVVPEVTLAALERALLDSGNKK